jgi:hypothetical protein
MRNTRRTAVRELIQKLNSTKSVEDAQEVFYNALELERELIAMAYDDARIDMAAGVTMDGLQYYDVTFDNQ